MVQVDSDCGICYFEEKQIQLTDESDLSGPPFMKESGRLASEENRTSVPKA